MSILFFIAGDDASFPPKKTDDQGVECATEKMRSAMAGKRSYRKVERSSSKRPMHEKVALMAGMGFRAEGPLARIKGGDSYHERSKRRICSSAFYLRLWQLIPAFFSWKRGTHSLFFLLFLRGPPETRAARVSQPFLEDNVYCVTRENWRWWKARAAF